MYIVHAPNADELQSLIADLTELHNVLSVVMPDSLNVAMLRATGFVENPIAEFVRMAKQHEYDDITDDEYDALFKETGRKAAVFLNERIMSVDQERVNRIVDSAAKMMGDLDNILHALNVMNDSCVMSSDLGPTCDVCKCKDDCEGCDRVMDDGEEAPDEQADIE